MVSKVVVAALLVLSPAVAFTQHEMTSTVPPRYSDPIPLYTVGLGPFTRPISSRNAEAQSFFTQGFQMMYAFAKPEAVRSFRESWKRDPECAICFWGEAWALGSYLNEPMTLTDAPLAYAALQKAMALKGRAPAREQAFIEALSVRYVEKFDPAKRVDQDRAYADAMQKLAERYPDDLDAVTLYGEALFLLEPRRGTRDANSPSVRKLHQVLESVLAKDIHHPGACHLYVHATESTTVPGKAAACAEFLAIRFPARVISITCLRTPGARSADGVMRSADNIKAWHSDLKAAIGEGFAIYPEHNLQHAGVRRLDGWPGANRDSGRQGLCKAHEGFRLSRC
jgi:hypothetical protein